MLVLLLGVLDTESTWSIPIVYSYIAGDPLDLQSVMIMWWRK